MRRKIRVSGTNDTMYKSLESMLCKNNTNAVSIGNHKLRINASVFLLSTMCTFKFGFPRFIEFYCSRNIHFFISINKTKNM